MRRTVRQMQFAAFAVCIVMLVSSGCVQKKRIYSEPAHYDHGAETQTESSAPAQAGRQSAELAVQQQDLTDSPAPAKSAQTTTVAAKPAETPASQPATAAAESTETGLASWIADDFQGLRTASGELYDKDALTAAHRTLPMNTRVEVTNLENGRFTVVRINDRGPFKTERVIDVSRRAAAELDLVTSGLAKVRLRVLQGQGAPSTATSQTSTTSATQQPAPGATPEAGSIAPHTPTQGGPWFVQVGAFQDRENAKQVLAGLFTAGYGQSRISRNQDDGLYRVQAGSFATRIDAEAALDALKPQYPAGYVINRSDSAQP